MTSLKVNTDFVVDSVLSTVENLQQDFSDMEYIQTAIFLEKEDLAGLETATTFL